MNIRSRDYVGSFLDKFRDIFPRHSPAFQGKHRRGHIKANSWRVKLQKRRKAERQHRRRCQLQAKGKKHTFRGRV